MELKEMTIEELEARKAEIATLVDAEDADLDALEAEARSINEELEALKKQKSVPLSHRARAKLYRKLKWRREKS